VDKWLVVWGDWIKDTHPVGANEKDGKFDGTVDVLIREM